MYHSNIIREQFLITRLICIIVLFSISINLGCKKLVEAEPPPVLVKETVFNNDNSTTAYINGIYSYVGHGDFSAPTSLTTISKYAALLADELTLEDFSFSKQELYYRNGLSVETSSGSEYWSGIFPIVYQCNDAIEGITASKTLSLPVKQQLLGEAKFTRGFLYFYLVNLFGDVPLVLTTDYSVTRNLPRSPKNKVYEQIIADLKDAKQLLSEDFLNGSLKKYAPAAIEKLRPTKWAAAAMLSRIYLYINDWANAETEASEVINKSSLFTLASLDDVFLKNSSEAIWQLQPMMPNSNTQTAEAFIIPPTGINILQNTSLSKGLLNSFEPGDNRKMSWVGNIISGNVYYFPYKYKALTFSSPVTSPSEYTMVLRLAEQYLIRAEARVHLSNNGGALSDINIIRSRARATPTASVPNPLPDLTSLLTDQEILDTISHERQVELFTEWGDRWFNLKRINKINYVMSAVAPQKGGTWEPYKGLCPILPSDILRNPLLVQNQGY